MTRGCELPAVDISKCCCFTGHRVLSEAEDDLESRITVSLETLINQKGVLRFYTGGAIGFDTIAAKTVICLRGKYPFIEFCLALPCRNQGERWGASEQIQYGEILDAADGVYYASETYTDGCMRRRNDYMLQNSLYCIALLRRSSGGTYYTVSKAKRLGRELIML